MGVCQIKFVCLEHSELLSSVSKKSHLFKQIKTKKMAEKDEKILEDYFHINLSQALRKGKHFLNI